MKRRRRAKKLPDHRAVIQEITIADVPFSIYYAQLETVHRATGHKKRDILKVYAHLSGDKRKSVDFSKALAVVQGELVIQWYTHRELPIPPSVYDNQERRIQEAKLSNNDIYNTKPKEGEKKIKGRMSARRIIREGLLLGQDEKTIIARVLQYNPDSSVCHRDVVWNRNKMIQNGEL